MADYNGKKIAIVGGGLSGCLAALAIAKHNTASHAKIYLFAPHSKHDARSTAVLSPALEFLEKLDLLSQLKDKGANLKTMRLLDGSNRLLRSPPIDFSASEAGLDIFGINFLNKDLSNAMMSALEALKNVKIIRQKILAANFKDDCVHLESTDFNDDFDMVIAADGASSRLREMSGVDCKKWSYPQVALVTNFNHSRPHYNVSTEFHTETGPMTTVPMPGNQSSLVWVIAPNEVDSIMALSKEKVSIEIERRMHSILGQVEITKDLQAFPLKGVLAKQFSFGRCVFIGEAAHVFPPIGAQGFNLGIRDIQAVLHSLDHSEIDIPIICAQYNRARLADVGLRTAAIHILNKSLLTNFLPMQFARSISLHTMIANPMARKFAMTLGLGNHWKGA